MTPTRPVAGRFAPLHWLMMVAVAVTFFIVEHGLTMSTTSESIESTDFVAAEVDSDVESGSAIRRVAFVGLGAVGSLVLLLSRRRLNLDHPLYALIGGLLLWTAVSVVWSADSGLTIRRLVVVGLSVAAAIGWTRLFDPAQSVRALLIIAAGYLALGVVCEIGLRTFRPWSGLYRFSGTTHPNTQGILCGLLAVGAVARAAVPGRRLWWIAGAVIALGFLYLTKSRTTLGATVVTIGVMQWLRMSWPYRAAALVAGSTLAVAALAASLLLRPGGDSAVDVLLMGRTEEIGTLTGRLPLWTELKDDIAARPLAGYGYGAFWSPPTLYRVAQNQGWQIPHSHSGYFETTLNLGLIGLGLVLAIGGVMLATAWRRDRPPRLETGFTIGLVLFAAIYSLADAGFALPSFASFALLLTALQTPAIQRSRPVVATGPGYIKPQASVAASPTPTTVAT